MKMIKVSLIKDYFLQQFLYTAMKRYFTGSENPVRCEA